MNIIKSLGLAGLILLSSPNFAQSEVKYHSIKKGENFSTIAKKYNVTLKSVIEANPDVNPKRIQIGQVIKYDPSVRADLGNEKNEGLYASDNILKFIQGHEKFREFQYNDAGHPAIAFGHRILPDEKFKQPLSLEEGIKLLKKDVSLTGSAVKRLVTVPVNNYQFDSLVSLTYNIGQGTFESSRLLKSLNETNYNAAADGFLNFNTSKGVVREGLTKRRSMERDIFLTPSK